jgi:hypothetical protein
MLMTGSWIIDNVPSQPGCKVLVDPKSERQCGNPATTGRTALDLPICEECFDAIRYLPEGTRRAA